MFGKLINNKNGIFGEVEDYLYRIEYQARGAGHTHTQYYGSRMHLSLERTVQKRLKHTLKVSAHVPRLIRKPHYHDTNWSLNSRHTAATNTAQKFTSRTTNFTRNIVLAFRDLQKQN